MVIKNYRWQVSTVLLSGLQLKMLRVRAAISPYPASFVLCALILCLLFLTWPNSLYVQRHTTHIKATNNTLMYRLDTSAPTTGLNPQCLMWIVCCSLLQTTQNSWSFHWISLTGFPSYSCSNACCPINRLTADTGSANADNTPLPAAPVDKQQCISNDHVHFCAYLPRVLLKGTSAEGKASETVAGDGELIWNSFDGACWTRFHPEASSEKRRPAPSSHASGICAAERS